MKHLALVALCFPLTFACGLDTSERAIKATSEAGGSSRTLGGDGGAPSFPVAGCEFADARMASLVGLALGAEDLTDLSNLLGLDSLERLTVNSDSFRDIDAASTMTSLIDVQLDGDEITDLSPLGDLPSVENLRVRATQLKSLEGLRGQPSLRALNVRDALLPRVTI